MGLLGWLHCLSNTPWSETQQLPASTLAVHGCASGSITVIHETGPLCQICIAKVQVAAE